MHYSGGCENCSHLHKVLRPKVTTIECNTTVDLDSNANQEPLNDNESCNWNFIPSFTLLDFEQKFKKPNPQPSVTSGTFENFPRIRQSPYYT